MREICLCLSGARLDAGAILLEASFDSRSVLCLTGARGWQRILDALSDGFREPPLRLSDAGLSSCFSLGDACVDPRGKTRLGFGLASVERRIDERPQFAANVSR